MKANNKTPDKKTLKTDVLTDTILDSISGNLVIVDNDGQIVKFKQSSISVATENGFNPHHVWASQDDMGVFKKLSSISNESASEPSEEVYFQYVNI